MTPRNELRGIGASEGPGVLGLSPYGGPSDVWLRKVGLAGERGDTAAMYAGRELERPILRLASDAVGIRFTHNRQTFTHPRYPEVPLYATPDGFGPRRHVGAEVKLVGHRFSDWRDGVPDYVEVQAHLQMACVPKLSRVIVAALVGSELRTFAIERDEVLEDRLAADLVDWWYRFVVAEVAPDPDSSAAAWRLYKSTARVEDRAVRIALPDEQAIGAELILVSRQVAELERREDELRRQLAAATAQLDVNGVGWSASWKARADVSWKTAAIAAGATAEQIEAATRHSSSFVFRSSASVDVEVEP